MSFPNHCSDHDYGFLMDLFRSRPHTAPLPEDEIRLTRAGWLCRQHDGALQVSVEVAEHFRLRRPSIPISIARQKR